jgi:hypothetical protein
LPSRMPMVLSPVVICCRYEKSNSAVIRGEHRALRAM